VGGQQWVIGNSGDPQALRGGVRPPPMVIRGVGKTWGEDEGGGRGGGLT